MLFTLAACDKDKIKDDRRNVSYGSDSQQKMDIYLPADRSTTNTKVLVLIHGGGWSGGDKSDFDAGIASIQQQLPGYAIFNINYRLVTGAGANRFPTQEQDVKAALEFIYARRSEYQISDKFVLLGASAGGHLALLQGYKYTSPVKPKAIVDFFGPTDMTALYNTNITAGVLIAFAIGATPASNASLYQQSSPITYVSAQSPPTIILQGGVDDLVPPSQSTSLQAKLNTAGVPNQYVFYPSEGHGWAGANLTDSYLKIAAFLTTHVQ